MMICWAWICFAVFIAAVVLYLLSPLVSPPRLDLKNAHIVITGGSSGIGKAIAKDAVTKGARVTLIARDKKKLEEAKNEVSSLNPDKSGKEVVKTLSVDLSGDYEVIEKAIAEAEASLGPVDFLINSAGISGPARFEEAPLSDFKRLMDVNYLSTVKVTKAVIPGMKARGRGRVVFVSSQAGQLGVYGYTAYSASKFALRGLAEALQMEMKPYNIHITLSFPPDTDTPMLQRENKDKPKATALISKTSHLVQPELVASLILNDSVNGRFLSSVGFEGWMLTCVTSGFAPVTSILEGLSQVALMSVLRIVTIGILYNFNRIIRSCKTQEDNSISTETKKSS